MQLLFLFFSAIVSTDFETRIMLTCMSTLRWKYINLKRKKKKKRTTTCRPRPKMRFWNVWNQIVSRNILSSLRYWLSSNTIIRGPFQNSNMVSPCKGCPVLIKDISNYFLLYLKLYSLFKCWTSLFACYFQTAVDRLIEEMRPVITSLLVRLLWILTTCES